MSYIDVNLVDHPLLTFGELKVRFCWRSHGTRLEVILLLRPARLEKRNESAQWLSRRPQHRTRRGQSQSSFWWK